MYGLKDTLQEDQQVCRLHVYINLVAIHDILYNICRNILILLNYKNHHFKNIFMLLMHLFSHQQL